MLLTSAENYIGYVPRRNSYSDIYTVSQKVPIFKLFVTSSNLNRFSTFLHCWKSYKICYETHTILPTIQTCCYTSLGNYNSNFL